MIKNANLGLIYRAGKLVKGTTKVLQAIRNKKAHLVLLADVASPNTQKLFGDKCNYYEIKLEIVNQKLFQDIDLDKQLIVIAITDYGFTQSILQLKGDIKNENKPKENKT